MKLPNSKKNGELKSRINLPASKLPTSNLLGEFHESFSWRIFRIMSEFVDGFQFLANFNEVKTVTFFGSARFSEDSHWYQVARQLGTLLGENDYGVVTGGGPGIMEAGNRGAFEGGGESIGINIKLPFEQRINQYVKKSIGFHYFFSRKTMLSYSAQAFVYFPGGFGTLDEFFELVTLLQTNKIPNKIPVICVGKEYWEPLLSWVDQSIYGKFQAIDKEDQLIYTIVDTAEEAFEIIKKTPHIKYFS
ncbi:TIGR00730 family Rossman fold protein [Candidatus Azambacteria bacterium]|nr:TIGR00730 family Rossman fold protein [Candidatus Azambacteria bacterium]